MCYNRLTDANFYVGVNHVIVNFPFSFLRLCVVEARKKYN